MHQATVAFKHPTMLPAILGNPAFRPCCLLPQRATFRRAGSQQSKCSSRTWVGLDSIWLPVCLLTRRNWLLVAYSFLPARSLRPAFFRPFIKRAILPLLKSTLSTVFFLSFTFSYCSRDFGTTTIWAFGESFSLQLKIPQKTYATQATLCLLILRIHISYSYKTTSFNQTYNANTKGKIYITLA